MRSVMLPDPSPRIYEGRSFGRPIFLVVIILMICVAAGAATVVLIKSTDPDFVNTFGTRRPFVLSMGVLVVLYVTLDTMTSPPRKIIRCLRNNGVRDIERLQDGFFGRTQSSDLFVRSNHPFWGFRPGALPPQGARGDRFVGLLGPADPRHMLTDGGIVILKGHEEKPKRNSKFSYEKSRIVVEENFGSWESFADVNSTIIRAIRRSLECD